MYKIGNKKFEYLEDAARYYKIRLDKVKYRLNKGGSLEESLGVVERYKFTIEGNHYKTMKAACDFYNKDFSLVMMRIKKLKWSVEEALEIENKNQIIVRNKIFKSIKQAADYHGMSHNTVKRRLDRGWSIDEAFDLTKRNDSPVCTGIVYKIKNKVNKKVYIGLTTQKLSARFNRHKYDTRQGSNTKLHRAMRKYGIENFKIRIVGETKDRHKLRRLEIKYIKKYNSVIKGYNTMIGGGSTGAKYGRPVKYDGVNFISLSALSEYIGISQDLIAYRLKNKIPLNKPLRGQKFQFVG